MTASRQDFIACGSLSVVDKKDIATLVAAVAIVGLLGVILHNPGWTSGTDLPVTSPDPDVTPVSATPTPTNEASPTPLPQPEDPIPARISYTSRYWEYPVRYLPDMDLFGASDPEWRNREVMAFAYLEETSGGLTEIFSVPYPLWRINCSLEATIHPQSALAQWILVNAETTEILEGGELRHPSRFSKNVQVSGSEMYFIIHVRDADRFSMQLETPLDIYTSIKNPKIL